MTTERDSEVAPYFEGRQRFLELVADIRPELHRYAARMLGSVADAEDVVQDTLARAFYALGGLAEVPPLRPWLFRIAHNAALDRLRSRRRSIEEQRETALEAALDEPDPEEALALGQATQLAIGRFAALSAEQRSAVILKDVLEHSLEEIAALLELSVPAVKAVLHRGRRRLAELAREPLEAPPPCAHSAEVLRFTQLFNARDWEGMRAMLTADVRLDVVSRAERRGIGVSDYFTNYAALDGWRMVPGFVDGAEVLLAHRPAAAAVPSYFIALGFEGSKICSIRDYYFVPYILRDALAGG